MNTTYRRLLTPLVTIITLCAITPSFVLAQNEGKWYKVEVLVFKRQGPEASANEYLRNNLDLSYPTYSRYLSNKASGNLALSAASQHKLGGYNYTLRRDEDFRVLFHKQWKQQMQAKSKSPAIVISGGQATGPHNELEGHIKLYVGRYLHIETDLWLSEFDLTATDTSRFPKLPSRPNTSTNSLNDPFSNHLRPSKISVLNEKRRMRSNELHYIDHPLMGILIQIIPLSG